MLVSSTVRLNIKANLPCFQCAFPFLPSSHFLLLIFRTLSQFRSRRIHFLKTSATQASINHFLPSVVRPFVPEPVHGPSEASSACDRAARSGDASAHSLLVSFSNLYTLAEFRARRISGQKPNTRSLQFRWPSQPVSSDN